MNALYRQDLRLFQNLFLPSAKLVERVRVGAGIRRVYARPQTPFDRVQACPEADPAKVAQLTPLRAQLDPFALTETVDQQLRRLYALAHHRAVSRPRAPAPQPGGAPASHRQTSQRSSRAPTLSDARPVLARLLRPLLS